MSVPLLFCWIRDKKLDLNNKNILDSTVIRSSINGRMLAELHPRAKRARARSPIAKEMW